MLNLPIAEGEHPLQTGWSLYFDKKLQRTTNNNNGLEDFKQNLVSVHPISIFCTTLALCVNAVSFDNPFVLSQKKLGHFNTMEGFWKHYAYLQNPDDLPKDHDIFMFRENKLPAWETFPNGGCWIIKVRKKNGIITRLWEELLFAAVGELFEEPDLCGVVLSTRARDDLISVWNSDNVANPDIKFKIGLVPSFLVVFLSLPLFRFMSFACSFYSLCSHSPLWIYSCNTGNV